MTPLRTPRLILRDWSESDRETFHRINADERVMAFFPMRRSRAESDAMMDRLRDDIRGNGFGWTAVELAESGACLGFVGLNRAEIAPAAPSGTLEIGWRLIPEAWGYGYVTEAAARWLDFAFANLGESRVISFAVVANLRSIAVMERLGMVPIGEFDNARVPSTHPQLKRHVLYDIAKCDWTARRAEALTIFS